MFGWKKRQHQINYDKTGKFPVIRASICTGERVAGFKDAASGRFEDLMLIRNEKDLKEFMDIYGVEKAEIKEEW